MTELSDDISIGTEYFDRVTIWNDHPVTRDLFKLGCDDQTPLGLFDTVVRDLE